MREEASGMGKTSERLLKSAKLFFLVILLVSAEGLSAQQIYTRGLIKADKLYIKKEYELAAVFYVDYLKKYPRDYYASRQAAICFDHVNDYYTACDHWPIVVESSEATESDYLAYARSLLQNDRLPEARKIFSLLAKSKDRSVAAWGRAYLDPGVFYQDSAACKITEVKELNTPFSESSPAVFGGKFLFTTDKNRSSRLYTAVPEQATQIITAFNHADSLRFTNSDLFSGFNTVPMTGQFCFSPDGAFLYFSKPVANDELGVKSSFAFAKYQLFILSMSTLNQAKPQVKPFHYNSPLYDYLHPSISKDGKKLFFVSNMKGSLGGTDIFVSELVNDEWSAPVNAGEQVNTAGNEVFPFIRDNGVLYFASDLRPGLGGLDLFSATPSGEDTTRLFKSAVNLGAPVNTRFDDFGIMFLPLVEKGYMSSNRKNNTDDDLYYFYYARE